MFAYGFTICDTDMRMWHADRSEIVVSEPFDFTKVCSLRSSVVVPVLIAAKEHADVVRFFMSALFASHAQLGWDPTIKRVGDNKKPCYEITVYGQSGGTRTFRTIEIISLTKAEAILGSATRVWRCVELDGQHNPIHNRFFALKDVWVDSDKSTEGTNYEELMKAARSSGELWVLGALEDTLLTIECHGYVSVDGVPQATKEVPDDSEAYKVVELTEHQKDGDARSFRSHVFVRSHAGFIKTNGPETTREHRKFHYRIVFSDAGDQLHLQTSLWRIFSSIGLVFLGTHATP